MRRATALVCIAILGLWLAVNCKSAFGGVLPTVRVLFVVTNHDKLGSTGKPTGLWLPELTHPYYAIKSSDGPRPVEITIASPKGGKAPIDPRSLDMKDPDNAKFMKDATTKAAIENTVRLSEVARKRFDAVFFVGGHGPMWDLPDDQVAQKIAGEVYDKGGVVAAVCHGPAALVNLKLKDGKYLVAGKKVTAFSNKEEDGEGYTKVVPFLLETKLKERGAKFSTAPPHKPNVVVDGRLITGQNPASARELGTKVETLVQQLPTK